jgi:hypothetical protein
MGGFKGVHEFIDALSLTPRPDNVKQIFRIVAPYWVDSQAAGRLPQLLMAARRRAAALNGARVSEFTALAYVRRAHPLSLLYSTIPIAGGGSGNLISHVEAQLCTWMREKGGETGSDEEIIAALGESEETYYAMLPGPIDDDSLGRILDRFPKITFILWTGELLDPDANMTRVDWLEPKLDLDKEQRAYRSCKDAMKILQRMESSSF